MDLANAMSTYFHSVTAELMFSGQKEGAIRGLIEEILTNSNSIRAAGLPTLIECAGYYPVALVEYAAAFDSDRVSNELAMEILTHDLGAHAYQIYFLNEAGRMALVRRLLERNMNRRATCFYIGGKLGHVSSCKKGEQLYSLIIAKTPIPQNIAAA